MGEVASPKWGSEAVLQVQGAVWHDIQRRLWGQHKTMCIQLNELAPLIDQGRQGGTTGKAQHPALQVLGLIDPRGFNVGVALALHVLHGVLSNPRHCRGFDPLLMLRT